MKKAFSFSMKFISVLLIAWLIFAQSCMTFKISDKKAVEDFKQKGLALQTGDEKLDGHTLHYVSIGDKKLPTLVFIHGSPGSWNAFEQYLKDSMLLARFHMISIDRPGFGHSDFGQGEHLGFQSEIISQLLRKIKSDQPMYLVGHSLGGPLIVELAFENPALINGIVILAGSVDPAEEKKEIWRPIFAYTPLQFLLPGAFRPSNDELMYFKKEVKQMPRFLSEIKCSVFIVHGDHDSLVPYGNALFSQKQLKHAASVELITLNADHFIPWTNYEDVKKVLLKL